MSSELSLFPCTFMDFCFVAFFEGEHRRVTMLHFLCSSDFSKIDFFLNTNIYKDHGSQIAAMEIWICLSEFLRGQGFPSPGMINAHINRETHRSLLTRSFSTRVRLRNRIFFTSRDAQKRKSRFSLVKRQNRVCGVFLDPLNIIMVMLVSDNG